MHLCLALLVLTSSTFAAQPHWVATWAPSPSPQLADTEQMRVAKLIFERQTLRQIAHVSLGGPQLRLRLSNAYGKQRLPIGSVHVALRAQGPGMVTGIVPGSDRVVNFSGRPIVTIPADAIVLSDPIALNVPDGADLVISLFLPQPVLGAGIHYAAQQTNYIAPGDQTAALELTDSSKLASWVYLAGVDVLAPQTAFTIVTFGDSITDGARSTSDTNRRWPDILAARFKGRRIAVTNAGIGGNRILHDAYPNSIRFGLNALARFDRDVLAKPGVRYVILLEGINDLGHAGTSAPQSETVTAQDLIAGMTQLIERAHERGVKVIGATILPFEGTVFPGYYTPEKEAKRQAINAWIRTGKAFDGVIDFDQTTRDPQRPGRVLAAYDGGDHLHPGDAGYQAMGASIDLKLFK